MGMAYSTKFSLNGLKQRFFLKQEMMQTMVENTIKEGAEEIAAKAKSNAPVDTHNLEDAIDVEKDNTRAGNVQYTVSCQGSGSTGRDVTDYAIIMEEQLQPYGSGPYNLDTGSQEKRDSGHDVGGKFMARAVEDKKPDIIAKVRKRVKDINRV